MLQYVNPMAINTWAIAEKYPTIRQVGLCHSVQGTAHELAHDLDIPYEQIRYRAAGINHMAFYLNFEEIMAGRHATATSIPISSAPTARAARRSPAGTRAARTRCATRC